MTKENKIKSVILGHAIGDALGVPFQFRYRDYFDNNPVKSMQGFMNYHFPPGTWSDDTSLSVCALESILLKNDIDYDDIMTNFVKWLYNNEFTSVGITFDVGLTCQIAISKYKYNRCENPILCGMDNENSNGNGSLMRINPFGLYLYYTKQEREKFLDIIHNASSLTHAHERAKMACGIYSFVLWEILDNPCKESIEIGLNKAKEYYKHYDELKTYSRLFYEIGKIDTNVSRDEINSSGYVLDSLEAAIWCLITTNNYKDCVLKAVNLGNDTDTIAAICGGLAGALYGFNSIPNDWLNILQRKEYLEKLCKYASILWKEKL